MWGIQKAEDPPRRENANIRVYSVSSMACRRETKEDTTPAPLSPAWWQVEKGQLPGPNGHVEEEERKRGQYRSDPTAKEDITLAYIVGRGPKKYTAPRNVRCQDLHTPTNTPMSHSLQEAPQTVTISASTSPNTAPYVLNVGPSQIKYDFLHRRTPDKGHDNADTRIPGVQSSIQRGHDRDSHIYGENDKNDYGVT